MVDDELERQLHQVLRNVSPPTTDVWNEAYQEEVLTVFERKIRLARFLTWGTLAMTLPITILGFAIIGFASNLKLLVVALVLVLGAGQIEVLMKLWYWIVQSRLQLQQEIKELRLHVAQLQLQMTERDREGDTT